MQHQRRTLLREAPLAAFAWVVVCAAALATAPAQAQTFTVLHQFTGELDGRFPYAGLLRNAAGNFYGSCTAGGPHTWGTVFELEHAGSGWIIQPLYSFTGGSDGGSPLAAVTIGASGIVYGTAGLAGSNGDGTAFMVRPGAHAPASVITPWTESVLYEFAPGSNGALPGYGALAVDPEGNLYGTTEIGGASNKGTVYELSPSGGGWTETVIASFSGGSSDGDQPYAGVIFDQAGDLYGTTTLGGTSNWGTVYELVHSQSGWTKRVLYSFTDGNDGGLPIGGLIFDAAGNLYGTAALGGANGNGTVFKLSPSSNGNWTFTTLYGFSGSGGPWDSLTMDAGGNLYGTTTGGGAYEQGSVFKLTLSGGSWIYTDLHDFTNGTDGGQPIGSVVLDSSGDIYGTAPSGGEYGNGVLFEITP
ncbi:MAG TPA: choice-of-anchor tandem repeat GloVer-containing protein [Terriglobales bacterium]|nr:choice-of-anchor tandem repeat GloVer-containing protein [Terriglobales bacterium]